MSARPWKWVVNPKHHSVELSEGSYGASVLRFRRWGMGGATPLFAVNGMMLEAHKLAAPEPGREHHADWWRIIDHPVARQIEALPLLLRAAHSALAIHEHAACRCEGCQLLRKAISAAEGKS